MFSSTYIHYIYAYIYTGGIYGIHKANITKKINAKFTSCLHISLIQLLLKQTQL